MVEDDRGVRAGDGQLRKLGQPVLANACVEGEAGLAISWMPSRMCESSVKPGASSSMLRRTPTTNGSAAYRRIVARASAGRSSGTWATALRIQVWCSAWLRTHSISSVACPFSRSASMKITSIGAGRIAANWSAVKGQLRSGASTSHG
ncbi:hypothetical protein ACFC8N_46625 [Streptomyces sp. NPDC055966]|uniref:hypothetical protein n=1 Tax=unclassified Streptomyces TaxID=2593676 RepID=UPI0035D9652E